MKISYLIRWPRRGACQGRWWESKGRLLLSASHSLGHGGWGLMQTGSSRRACRQLAVRAQKHRQRLHHCMSGHKSTEKLLMCKRRGEPCPCLLPRKVRAHGTTRLLCKHRGFKCTKQVSCSSRRKLFLDTDQTQTTAPCAGEEAGLHLPALGESGSELPAAAGTPTPIMLETTFGICSNSGLCSLNWRGCMHQNP